MKKHNQEKSEKPDKIQENQELIELEENLEVNHLLKKDSHRSLKDRHQ
jgi:hypothetical protein